VLATIFQRPPLAESSQWIEFHANRQVIALLEKRLRQQAQGPRVRYRLQLENSHQAWLCRKGRTATINSEGVGEPDPCSDRYIDRG